MFAWFFPKNKNTESINPHTDLSQGSINPHTDLSQGSINPHTDLSQGSINPHTGKSTPKSDLEPLATIVTLEMAAELKQKKYQERVKKEQSLAEIKRLEQEQKRLQDTKNIYDQCIKAINKWIYDENNIDLYYLYTPVFDKQYDRFSQEKMLNQVVPMIQEYLGNSYKVILVSAAWSQFYMIRVDIVLKTL
jgi:hypothetical protein